jgi:hypothetical protein
MAHFYGSVKGHRGEASRTGTKKSGISAHIRGRNIGIRVDLRHDEKNGKDFCTIYETGGSAGGSSDTLIADLSE